MKTEISWLPIEEIRHSDHNFFYFLKHKVGPDDYSQIYTGDYIHYDGKWAVIELEETTVKNANLFIFAFCNMRGRGLKMSIGQIIGRLRRNKGLSQVDLATLCNKARSTIANIETDRINMAFSDFLDISKGLGCSPVYLLEILLGVYNLPPLETKLLKRMLDRKEKLTRELQSLETKLTEAIK